MLSALATVINNSVDKVHTSTLDAARQIGMRFHQIGTAMSGSCTHNNADESVEMNIPRTSKSMMDALRRNHPKAFDAYASVAQKFVELDSKQQTDFLQKQAPGLLLVLTSSRQGGKRSKFGIISKR